MDASLHVEAMGWLRFGKRLSYVATEAGGFNADVLGADKFQLIEVEVKKSRSDLLRDFQTKAWKHMLYNGPGEAPHAWVPNWFYFVVPVELGDWAKEQLEAKKTPAGLLVLNKASYSTGYVPRGNLVVKKRPKQLHDRPPQPGTLSKLAERMANELTSLRLILEHRLPGEEGGANIQELLKSVRQLGDTPDWEKIDADSTKYPRVPPEHGIGQGQDDLDRRGSSAGDDPTAHREVQAPPNCS